MTAPEAAGSSPASAITDNSEMSGFLFLNRVTGHRFDKISM